MTRFVISTLAALALGAAHDWDGCYGMFPPPAEILGYDSASFTFSPGTGFKNNTMHYVRRKPAAAKGQVRHETLLFVHGWPDSWRSWQRVLPLLDSRFHVVAVDLLGFGESSKPDKASYSVTMFAENLHSFISGLGLDNVVLVGHGMGSFHAWVYAAKHPSKLAGLVTIGSAATIKGHTKITNTLKAVVKSQGKSFTYKGAKDFQLSTLYKPTEVPQWHLETMAHESLSAPLSIARRTIEHLMVADYAQQLEDIDTDDLPTLLIWGEHDSMFPEQLRNNFSAALPGSEVKIIPNAGHSAHWEQPAAFAKILNDFIVLEPATDARAKGKEDMAEGSGVIVAGIFFLAVGLPVMLTKSARHDRIAHSADEYGEIDGDDGSSTSI